MSKKYSWVSDENASPQFLNEADRRLELANLVKESEDDRIFAYESVNGGAKTVTLTRNQLDMFLKMSKEASEDGRERVAFFHRSLLMSKYVDQLCEKKSVLRQKGLANEEIKTTLERLRPEAELLAILKPSALDDFIRMGVECVMQIDE